MDESETGVSTTDAVSITNDQDVGDVTEFATTVFHDAHETMAEGADVGAGVGEEDILEAVEEGEEIEDGEDGEDREGGANTNTAMEVEAGEADADVAIQPTEIIEVVDDTVVEESAAEESVVEESVVVESVAEEPMAEESMVEESMAEEPAVDYTAEETIVEDTRAYDTEDLTRVDETMEGQTLTGGEIHEEQTSPAYSQIPAPDVPDSPATLDDPETWKAASPDLPSPAEADSVVVVVEEVEDTPEEEDEADLPGDVDEAEDFPEQTTAQTTPVVLTFETQRFALVPHDELPGYPPLFESDLAYYQQPLVLLWSEAKHALESVGYSVPEDVELVAEFVELGLVLNEDNVYCDRLEFSELCEVFEGLCDNSRSRGEPVPTQLTIALLTQNRFIMGYNRWGELVNDGLGFGGRTNGHTGDGAIKRTHTEADDEASAKRARTLEDM